MLVVCSGMYKSGSTLQYNVAREVLSTDSKFENHGFASSGDLNRNQDELIRWRDDSRWHLIKSHDLLPKAVSENADGVYTLYTYRDLRDVAASTIRHFQKTHQETISLLQHAIEVHDAAKNQGHFLEQRYEWSMQHPAQMVEQVFEFFGHEGNQQTFEKIAQSHSLGQTQRVAGQVKNYMRMRALARRMIRTVGMENRSERLIRKVLPGFTWTGAYHPTHLVHPGHIDPVNPGGSGKWKQQLDPELIEVIESRFEPWLRKHNYEI